MSSPDSCHRAAPPPPPKHHQPVSRPRPVPVSSSGALKKPAFQRTHLCHPLPFQEVLAPDSVKVNRPRRPGRERERERERERAAAVYDMG
ncbi:hypothetical protein CGRA01v4_04026 [Colletotrichum graminicola]|nr:hypothetical protein CGRA01v4_04026 [Colletotrichum graminicola]